MVLIFGLVQVCGFYQWTYTYHLVKTSSMRLQALEDLEEQLSSSNGDLQTHLLPKQNGGREEEEEDRLPISISSNKTLGEVKIQDQNDIFHSKLLEKKMCFKLFHFFFFEF